MNKEAFEKVRAAMTIVIDRRSEAVVAVQPLVELRNMDVEVSTVERSQKDFRGIVNGIVDGSDLKNLVFVNLSGSPVTIREGQTVGIATRLEQSINIVELGTVEEECTQQTPQLNSEPEDVVIGKFTFSIRGDLNVEQRNRLVQFLRDNIDRFAEDVSGLNTCNILQHEIRTGNAAPFQEALRRIPFAQRTTVDDIVNQMIEKGIARPSKSPWASAIVMVRKKDGSWRLCVDYRRLNALSTADRYPLPRIEDLLARVSGSLYFSTFDLSSGF